MNELRESIRDAFYSEETILDNNGVKAVMSDSASDEQIDKVLTAILQALPEERYKSSDLDRGYNNALREFRTILEQAKELSPKPLEEDK